MKDIRTGEQVAADPTSWSPDPIDLHPTIVVADATSEKKEKSS